MALRLAPDVVASLRPDMDITRARLVGRVTAMTRRAARTGRQASDLHDFSREIGPTTFARESSPVTAALYARLTAEDVAEVEAAAREHPELAGLLEASTESGHRLGVIVNSALWLRVQAVIDKLGLDRHDPPEVVHAMARGPLAVAGGLYEADLIVDALVSAGVDPDALETALDFGCSSGRVVRVLSRLWPETRWLGCDPNAQAIGWARESIPSAEFFVNAGHPPLPIGDATLDLVYAVSIWSPFSVSAGT